MNIFTRLFKVSTTGTKIKILAFAIFSNVAFADSESLQKLFKEYNVSKDKQEYINKECNKEVLKDNFKDLSKIEQIYKFEVARIDCEVNNLGEVLGSTQGILASLNYGYDEYDKLLNKYYKLYRAEVKKQNKTTPTGAFSHEPSIQKGQDTLLEEQRAWLKLRDSYEAYIRKHHAHIYDINGGGTIYSIEASNARLTLLKKRVEELFKRYVAITTGGNIDFYNMFDVLWKVVEIYRLKS
ncbi:MAG: lysozyme inhibitor LprI family protein [Helicobacter sp.]|uniref:lysozyme inhibitor LprI family protein n=1 Tax=Helicobacter sp. TaxID=218 RepID=UPI002A90EF3B|nr:lysozyme inhibitor LprI family protein [Helicobacter sp.]MDY5950339.1 lysozyme inhibitor LprI family protein [Helicobacter sp.]